MKKIIGKLIVSIVALGISVVQGITPHSPVGHFELVSTYNVSGEVAEIAAIHQTAEHCFTRIRHRKK
jgi:hypothetical protein